MDVVKQPALLQLSGNLRRKWPQFNKTLELFLTATSSENPSTEALKAAILISAASDDALDMYKNFVFAKDPRLHTRSGNSVSRDTTLDLTFLRGIEDMSDNLQEGDEAAPPKETYADLLKNLHEAVNAATNKMTTDVEVPEMDSRLTHLLEAKHALSARLMTQKHNRRLGTKIVLLSKKIQSYSPRLARQQ
ncbi:hypothetical protein HPB50_018429 [Hyalomma asiaticum]|uniref:Uncharacterized protein n=1 Tax=Hyalomma asiaticum TaxID=266040 RepID=A0ACB7T898_HYAAI|nr:hypothetical protein HPB50_018429 [Hyalomma asiaticum]